MKRKKEQKTFYEISHLYLIRQKKIPVLQMSIARRMNSLAPTVDASRKGGSVTDRMTVAIIPMKVTTARKTLVHQTIISIAVIMSVFPTRGNAMALLTALTDRTKR
jgi:hypothetical protein